MFWTWSSFRHTELWFYSLNIATVYGDFSGYALLDFWMLK
jgi:hypothetical protein